MSVMGVLEEVRKRWFLIGVVAVISLAKMYPWFGAKGGGSVHRYYSIYGPWCCSNRIHTLIPIISLGVRESRVAKCSMIRPEDVFAGQKQ